MRGIFREDGATLVETSLSCGLLLMLVFGIIEVCQGLYAYHYVAQAARMASRYAMVRGSSCTGCTASASEIQTYIQGLDYPGINSSDLTVTTTWPTTGTTCTPSSLPCNNPGNLVQVQVEYALGLPVPFLPTKRLTLSSTSEVVIQQ